jgi:hypothetical protein
MAGLRIASTLALTCFAVLAARAAPAVRDLQTLPRAVIELFTSQGCSSCPPADKLMAELANDPSLIVMSLAVDYWDYLGWKDTLALHGHSNRQRAYANTRADREVYTPQVVVNGIAHALGSDKAAIERTIHDTAQRAHPLTLAVTMSVVDGKVTVNVSADPNETGQGEVWLCPISKSVTVAIGRGENSGHSLTYTNVVRRWVKLGEWTGKAQSFSVPLASVQNSDIDSLAVVVQNGAATSPKLMLGAAQIAIR